MSASTLEFGIIQSVLYAALFDYPLTVAQVRATLPVAVDEDVAVEECYRSSAVLREIISYESGYYFPHGRRDLIQERRQREIRSRLMLAQNRRLLKLICSVPYTRLIALSGSVAHLNVDPKADLDLFVLTRGPRVWSVTVTILLLAKLLGRRRSLCVNYVLSDERLCLDQPDLFTANQIVHLRPIVGGDAHRSFVRANPFVAQFYPNGPASTVDLAGHAPGRVLHGLKRSFEWLGRFGPSQLLEAACRAAYGGYLRRQSAGWRSPDQVRLQSDCLKLHTQSHRGDVLTRFEDSMDRALAQLQVNRGQRTSHEVSATGSAMARP